MKRCPQCNRVETDDALAYCRRDGTPLVAQTSIASESSTRVLDQRASASNQPSSDTHQSVDQERTISALGARLPAKPESQATAKAAIRVRGAKWLATLAVSVIVAIAAGWYFYLNSREVPIESVAVLPFVNQSGDQNTEYLAEGVTESVMNSLTQIPNLKVIARSSVFRYRSKDVDPLAAGKELGVRAVLTGRITQRGDDLNVSVELMDVRDNKHIWGERYDRKAGDLLAVQRQIAWDVSINLRLKLSGAEQSRVTKHYTDNTDAYRLYLEGRYHWNKRTIDGLKKGIEFFRQAIQTDPNYALAYSGLADCYMLLSEHGAVSAVESMNEARQALGTALQLDASLAEAHASRGLLKELYERDWPEAEREFLRAIELNPNYSTAYQWYGIGLVAQGRTEEGLNQLKRALEVDPVSSIAHTNVGWAHYLTRRFDAAKQYYRRNLELDSNYPGAHRGLGWVMLQTREFPEAISELQTAVRLDDSEYNLASLGFGYALAGNRPEAEKVLRQLKDHSPQRHVSAVLFAVVYAGLNDKEEAFKWLEKADAERESLLAFSSVDPFFDNLRTDARFRDLLQRLRLPAMN